MICLVGKASNRFFAKQAMGNVCYYSRDLFTAPITCQSSRYVTVEINGHTARFDRTALRYDNRGHSPSYQLFLTVANYEPQVEVEELRRLMNRTDFTRLAVDKQKAIRAILET